MSESLDEETIASTVSADFEYLKKVSRYLLSMLYQKWYETVSYIAISIAIVF